MPSTNQQSEPEPGPTRSTATPAMVHSSALGTPAPMMMMVVVVMVMPRSRFEQPICAHPCRSPDQRKPRLRALAVREMKAGCSRAPRRASRYCHCCCATPTHALLLTASCMKPAWRTRPGPACTRTAVPPALRRRNHTIARARLSHAPRQCLGQRRPSRAAPGCKARRISGPRGW